MANTIKCETHGECQETFVCNHLTEGAAGLGFNRADPSEENPFPDAWCDDCDVIFQAHEGWSDETDGLISIQLLCSGCYERARIRNSRTDVTFEELSEGDHAATPPGQRLNLNSSSLPIPMALKYSDL